MRVALYQPEIPQNTGTIMRLCACMGVGADIIEPCGFIFSDRRMRRAGMDYIDQLDLRKFSSWDDYKVDQRLILLTPYAETIYTDFNFNDDDILLLGKESTGVPESILNSDIEKVRIPMQPGFRSLNVAIACAMVLGEALRQIKCKS
jgi:tRNA (cytidine/uridine-2'-O-)-methyltransferase